MEKLAENTVTETDNIETDRTTGWLYRQNTFKTDDPMQMFFLKIRLENDLTLFLAFITVELIIGDHLDISPH